SWFWVGLGWVGFCFDKVCNTVSDTVSDKVCNTVFCGSVRCPQNPSRARAANALAWCVGRVSSSLIRAIATFGLAMGFHRRKLGKKSTFPRRYANPMRDSSDRVSDTVSDDHPKSSVRLPSVQRKHPNPFVYGPVIR